MGASKTGAEPPRIFWKKKIKKLIFCIFQPIPIFFTLEKSLAMPEIRSQTPGLLNQCSTYKLQVFVKERVIKLEFKLQPKKYRKICKKYTKKSYFPILLYQISHFFLFFYPVIYFSIVELYYDIICHTAI